MILLVDIGNSRIKWACLEGERLSYHGSSPHQNESCDTAAWDELPEPDAVYCASVADLGVNHWLAQQVGQRWDLSLQMLQTTDRCAGVINGYREPSKLGVDRWAALIGARSLTPSPLCVVDCGSAVTVDALDGEGHHLGGFIIPGLLMQQELLQRGIAAIKNNSSKGSNGGWGRDTAECMSRGSIEALAGLIERSRGHLQESLGEEATVYITGGDALSVASLLDFEPRHEAHLVLSGMARIIMEQGV